MQITAIFVGKINNEYSGKFFKEGNETGTLEKPYNKT